MVRIALIGVVLVTACGRLRFDPITDGGDGDGGDAGRRVAYLKASNTDPGDELGASLAMSRDGSTIAIGAPLESSNARTVNGNEADNSSLEQGAVYVFRRTGATWAQEAYIKASNGDAGDQFGWSVALSGDGSTLVVGARHEDSASVTTPLDNSAANAGAAYVYMRVGTAWSEIAYLKAQTAGAADTFGESVAISDDALQIAVGAPLEDSSATTINGDPANNNSTDSGAVYTFSVFPTTWSQYAYIKASNNDAGDELGWRISLTGTGDSLAASAFREDSNATGVDGNPADDSTTNAGATYLLSRSGVLWTFSNYVKASNTDAGDDFGYSVVNSADGSALVVSAEGEASGTGDPTDNSAPAAGALYLFRPGPLHQALYMKAPNGETNDELGYGLATTTSGDMVVAGAPFEKSAATGWDGDAANNAAPDAGAAYLFSTTGAFATHYIKAAQTSAGDQFGWQCAMSGNGSVLAIAAPFEDGSGRGVDAPVDEAATDAGAVYVYY